MDEEEQLGFAHPAYPSATEDLDAPQYPGYKAMRTSQGDLFYAPTGEPVPPESGGAAPFVPLPAVTVTPEPEKPPETVAAKIPDNTELRALGPTPAEELAQLAPPPAEPPDVSAQLAALAPPPEGEEEELPQERPENVIAKSTVPLRMGLAKFAEHPGNLFYGLPGALFGLIADIEEARGGPPEGEKPLINIGARDISEWLKQAAGTSKRGVEKIAGVEGYKPQTAIEKAATWTGEYVTPTKGVSAVATTVLGLTGAAIRGGLTTFSPEDVPIPKLVREAGAAEDPLAKALGLPKPEATFPNAPVVQSAPVPGAPKVQAEPPPGSKIFKGAEGQTIVVPPPDLRTTAPPKISPKRKKGNVVESDEAFKQRLENKWVQKEIDARTYTPTATEIFESVGGMQHTSSSEYKMMGIVGGVLVGMLIGKPLLSLARTGRVPAPKPVKNAAPGTASISAPQDVFRALDDINAPLTMMARRAGMDPTALSRVQELFRIQTRNGARALADSAIELGRIETPAFRFQARTSLSDMARLAPPRSDEYLKLLDTFEQIAVAKKATVVNGHTLQSAQRAIVALEAANPALRQIGKANRDWNNAVRKFQQSGEYGTITRQQLTDLNTSQKNSLGGTVADNAFVGQAGESRRLLSQRLRNEAIGTYVDEMRRVDPRLFVKVSEKDLEANPAWRMNTIRFRRRGEQEYYTTDSTIADILRTDYHMLTMSNPIYAMRRTLETTTTGNLAPQFAPVSALRSYWIAKFTTERGFRSPTAIGSIMAIPQQLVPQLARSVAHGLEYGSGGTLNKFFPQQWTDSLARRLTDVFEQSVFAQIKAAGSHRGHYIEQAQRAAGLQQATSAINAAVAANPAYKGAQIFWNGWRAALESIHNGPAFNFVKRNLGTEPLPSLALRARRLTGDPRTQGQLISTATGKPIRYESHNMIDRAVVQTLKYGYGYPVHYLSQWTPWWNATLQGAKRIGEAYMHDPIRFTRSTVMYAMAPAAGLFYYAKALDKDPNGKSYLDYMLNGRSAYNRQMNFYVPIPGRPVEDGVEVTFFHELNPFKRAAEIALHHMLGSDIPQENLLLSMPDNVTARRTLKEDLWIAAHMFFDTAINPPMPPIVSGIAAMGGVRLPQGLIPLGGGEAYKVKGDPFNQNGGLPAALETMTRNLFGGVGEALGAFYANATQSEQGILNALKNGMKSVGVTYAKKTPFLRDVTGFLPDRSNVTDLASEVFENQKEINDLARFYRKWTVNEGQINVKPASTGGGVAVTEQYGLQQLDPGNPGLYQPDPTNPLYAEFMQEFYNRFMKESPNPVKGRDDGGVGFKSLWRNYGTASRKLESLKDVNYGTYDRWQREMDQGAREELERNGVDTTDRRQVVNFYKTMQYDALRVINNVRRATEKQMSERAGRPIRLKDIKPYTPGGESPFIYPELIPEFGTP